MEDHMFETDENFQTGALVACCSCGWSGMANHGEAESKEEAVRQWQAHIKEEGEKFAKDDKSQ